MKGIRETMLVTACCFLSGCGMLATPHRVTMPNASLQKVLVLDQQSRQPLEGATVTCQMYEYKNWMKPVPFWGVCSSTNTVESQVAERPDQKVWQWRAQPQGRGVFSIEPRKRTGWTQIWFPLPSPLGWFLYRTYDGRITASVPEHDSVWISNAVATDQTVFMGSPRGEKSEQFFRLEENQVTIMLPKEKSSHNQAPEDTARKIADPQR